MSLKQLVKDEAMQQLLKEKLAAGEKFELISICDKEKMTFEELKQNFGDEKDE